jgi:hypothetical protein
MNLQEKAKQLGFTPNDRQSIIPFISDKFEDGYFYNETGNYEVYLVKKKDSDLVFWLRESKGKYKLFLVHEQNLGLSYYSLRHLEFEAKEPNEIGVFTEKKILDWLAYGEAKFLAEKRLLEQVNYNNAIILAEIEEFARKVKSNVDSLGGGNKRVSTKNFTVNFTIDTHIGSVSNEIKFIGKLDDVVKLLNQ